VENSRGPKRRKGKIEIFSKLVGRFPPGTQLKTGPRGGGENMNFPVKPFSSSKSDSWILNVKVKEEPKKIILFVVGCMPI
jgi:hypothetical protein